MWRASIFCINDRETYPGLIRLHILYRAAAEPVSGSQIRSELKKKGCYISGSNLYPVLLRLSNDGYLALQSDDSNRNSAKLYRTTDKGINFFRESKLKIREMFDELFEAD